MTAAIFESSTVQGSQKADPQLPAGAAERKQLRDFGLLVGGVFLLLAAISLWRHRERAPYFGSIGGILFVLGVAAPMALASIYKVWMAIAHGMGFVMTRVILTVMYFGVMTPFSLILRVVGADPLNVKIDKKLPSYWDMRPDPKPGQGKHFTSMF